MPVINYRVMRSVVENEIEEVHSSKNAVKGEPQIDLNNDNFLN